MDQLPRELENFDLRSSGLIEKSCLTMIVAAKKSNFLWCKANRMDFHLLPTQTIQLRLVWLMFD